MLNKIIELGISKREAEELIKVSKNINKDYKLLKKSYPIQYLIGYVDFFGYKILVNRNVLIPRYETELLVEETLKQVKNYINPKILDIGTGSGAIAISLNKETALSITAIDISKKALKIATKSAKINNADVNFIHSNLLNKIKDKYDIIVSNPPYISYNEEIMETVKKYEPKKALYAKDNGIYFYKKILQDSKEVLNTKSTILFEIGYTQAKEIKEYAKQIYPNSKVTVKKDYSNKDRIIIIENE